MHMILLHVSNLIEISLRQLYAYLSMCGGRPLSVIFFSQSYKNCQNNRLSPPSDVSATTVSVVNHLTCRVSSNLTNAILYL